MKTLYFDMDGTIADLYAVNDWLVKLRKEDATPYRDAAPLCDMHELSKLLNKAKTCGYRIGVISWLAREATEEYKQAITKAKKEWLAQYLNVKLDEAHFVQYGTRKDYVARDKRGLLFDDDAKVREKWRGLTSNPKEENINERILKILK